MTDEYETYEDYWNDVQRNARISLDEEIENNEDDDPYHLIHDAVDSAMEGAHILMYYPRSVIYHTDTGFDGPGYEIFVRNAEFEDNDPHEMINALARSAYYNDLTSAMKMLIERRESLGQCMNLIGEHPIWDKGVTFEYEYTHGHGDNEETYTFLLECLGENEWKMFNPEDEAFEVISPSVIVEDKPNPERALDIRLSTFCAQELYETKRL